MNKQERLAELKRLSAEIGMLELMRSGGIYVPQSKIEGLKRQFKKLSIAHRQESLNF